MPTSVRYWTSFGRDVAAEKSDAVCVVTWRSFPELRTEEATDDDELLLLLPSERAAPLREVSAKSHP